MLSLDGGAIRRLTYDDASEVLDGWSSDGRWVYFSTRRPRRLAHERRLPRPRGGRHAEAVVAGPLRERVRWPRPLPTDRRSPSSPAAASGSGGARAAATSTRAQLWLRRDGRPPRYERLTDGSARDSWPMWAPDGRGLYFVSDRGGAAERLVAAPLEGAARAVTSFRDGRVVWPADRRARRHRSRSSATSGSGRSTRRAARRPPCPSPSAARRRGAPVEHLSLTPVHRSRAVPGRQEGRLRRARGRLRRVGKGRRRCRPCHHDAAAESDLAWRRTAAGSSTPPSATAPAALPLRLHRQQTERPLTTGPGDDRPPPSPDGKEVAFPRDGASSASWIVDSGRERLVATGHFDRHPFVGRRDVAWSPDGSGSRTSRSGEKAVHERVDRARGRRRRGAPGELPRERRRQRDRLEPRRHVPALHHRPAHGERPAREGRPAPARAAFREDQFRDLFREETPPGADAAARPRPPLRRRRRPHRPRRPRPPGRVAAERRGSRWRSCSKGSASARPSCPSGSTRAIRSISPDGKWVVLVATAAGQSNLWSIPSTSSRTRSRSRASSPPPPATSRIRSSPGQQGGLLPRPGPDPGGAPRRQAAAARRHRRARHRLRRGEGGRLHPGLGVPARQLPRPRLPRRRLDGVRAAYAPRVGASRTPDELRRTLNLMIGELNSSHTGHARPARRRRRLRSDGSAFRSTARSSVLGPPAHRVHPSHGPADVNGRCAWATS